MLLLLWARGNFFFYVDWGFLLFHIPLDTSGISQCFVRGFGLRSGLYPPLKTSATSFSSWETIFFQNLACQFVFLSSLSQSLISNSPTAWYSVSTVAQALLAVRARIGRAGIISLMLHAGLKPLLRLKWAIIFSLRCYSCSCSASHPFTRFGYASAGLRGGEIEDRN